MKKRILIYDIVNIVLSSLLLLGMFVPWIVITESADTILGTVSVTEKFSYLDLFQANWYAGYKVLLALAMIFLVWGLVHSIIGCCGEKIRTGRYANVGHIILAITSGLQFLIMLAICIDVFSAFTLIMTLFTLAFFIISLIALLDLKGVIKKREKKEKVKVELTAEQKEAKRIKKVKSTNIVLCAVLIFIELFVIVFSFMPGAIGFSDWPMTCIILAVLSILLAVGSLVLSILQICLKNKKAVSLANLIIISSQFFVCFLVFVVGFNTVSEYLPPIGFGVIYCGILTIPLALSIWLLVRVLKQNKKKQNETNNA